MRVALVSPYSWTYPGGVTRHIEALAAELLAAGPRRARARAVGPRHARTALRHRGARPQRARGARVADPARPDDRLAVQRRGLEPRADARRRSPRCAASCAPGGYDVVHLHEPVAPVDRLGRAHARPTRRSSARSTATPRASRRTRSRRCSAPGASSTTSRVRIAVSEAAAWTGRRFYGGEYRVVPNGVDAARRRRARAAAARCRASRSRSRSSARPSSARACRCCCAPSRRCASTCPRG